MMKESSVRGVAIPSSSKEEFQQFAADFQAAMENWIVETSNRPLSGIHWAQAAQAHEDIFHNYRAVGK